MTYSVAIVSRQSGLSETSRFFNTKKAALNWARFLRTLGNVAETAVYQGHPGGVLIERKGA
jgi:hypothetical protein